MNRWIGDARNQVETSESVGGNAGSVDSSFGSTPSKRTKNDLKLRTSQTPKPPFWAENLPLASLRQSMSLNNEGGSSLDVQQDRNYNEKIIAGRSEALCPGMQVSGVPLKQDHENPVFPEQVFDLHHIRDTILKQEAVFREQVRELHRVHKVQALLLAELRKKDCVMVSHSPPDFVNSAGRWNCPPGQVSKSSGHKYDGVITLPENLKIGSSMACSDSDLGIPTQEVKLFTKSVGAPPVRRTFDLERLPEDNDDDCDGQSDHDNDNTRRMQGIQFLELPASGDDESESDTSLNLSFGRGHGKSRKDMGEYSDKSGLQMAKTPKRLREGDASLPFLLSMSDRDVSLCPTPTEATQTFLGGLWGLQLGRKPDDSPRTDGNMALQESEVPVKMERRSLDLQLTEKALPVTTSNRAPHWLRQAAAGKPLKNLSCSTESSSPCMQDSISPSQNSTSHEILKSIPSQWGRGYGSGSGPGITSVGEQQVSSSLSLSQSQSSNNSGRVAEEDVEAGLPCASQAPVFAATRKTSPGYGLFQLGRETSPEAPAVHSPWREGGEAPPNGFAHSVITQNHPLPGGFGLQLRAFDRTLGLPTQGLVQVGPALNMGPTKFVPDSGPGVWYQQRNIESHLHQYQQHQQQAPWQAPFQIPRSAAYGQAMRCAIPVATGPSIAFPVDSTRKIEDHTEANWTSNAGPPFSPFSIVVPPKAPFKRPPKLVLSHGSEGTTMELKLVSSERDVAGNIVEKSCSGSSDEDGGEKRAKGHIEGVLPKERDMSARSRAEWETVRRAYPLKDKGSLESGTADWMVGNVSSIAVHSRAQAGINGVPTSDGSTLVAMALQEGMDDGDGGSSDAGSGGSGVGDVINPGDHASPSPGAFSLGESGRNLPAGEGEEGINMGEIGLQADSEAQFGKLNKESLDDSRDKLHEVEQGQFSSQLSCGNTVSLSGRTVLLEHVDGSGHEFERVQKCMRPTLGLVQEVDRTPGFHGLVEQSSSSFGVMKNLLDVELQSRALYPTRQNSKASNHVPLELQQPTISASQPRIHKLIKWDCGSQGKESSVLVEGSDCSVSDHCSTIAIERHGGRLTVDINGTGVVKTTEDLRTTNFTNFGDVSTESREFEVGHSKQLPGASTFEKDVLDNAFGPGLRQISSPTSREDMERQAEASSKKVSQASETVQGNGGSPLRTGEWNVPTAQKHWCSPGGSNSSCEEVDGTLVKRLQGTEMEQKDSIHFCAVGGRQIFASPEGRKMASIFVLG